MPAPLGASFAPTFENADPRMRGGSGQPSAQALQVLSYRLNPRVAGAPGVSPLQGQRQAGSSIGQAVLESVLRTVLGSDAASEVLGADRSGLGQMPGASGLDPGIGGISRTAAPTPVVHVGDVGSPMRGPTDDPTPRGTNDPTHDGLQAFLASEQGQRYRAPSFGPSTFQGYAGAMMPRF